MVDSHIVLLNRAVRDLQKIAKPAFSGLLAALLFVLGLLAASGPLHLSLHHGRTAGANFCAVCLLTKGQVELSDIAPLLISVAFFLLCGLLAATDDVTWSVNSLLPPERAPPPLASVS